MADWSSILNQIINFIFQFQNLIAISISGFTAIFAYKQQKKQEERKAIAMHKEQTNRDLVNKLIPFSKYFKDLSSSLFVYDLTWYTSTYDSIIFPITSQEYYDALSNVLPSLEENSDIIPLLLRFGQNLKLYEYCYEFSSPIITIITIDDFRELWKNIIERWTETTNNIDNLFMRVAEQFREFKSDEASERAISYQLGKQIQISDEILADLYNSQLSLLNTLNKIKDKFLQENLNNEIIDNITNLNSQSQVPQSQTLRPEVTDPDNKSKGFEKELIHQEIALHKKNLLSKSSTKLIKVLLAGDGATGKTAFRTRYLSNTFKKVYLMTIGADFAVKPLTIDNRKVKMQIWDLAGQMTFRDVANLYFHGSNAVILMFDLARSETFYGLERWVLDLKKVNPNIITIVFGAKNDLPNRTVSYEEAVKFTEKIGAKGYLEGSSLTGENVDEAFEKIAELVIRNRN